MTLVQGLMRLAEGIRMLQSAHVNALTSSQPPRLGSIFTQPKLRFPTTKKSRATHMIRLLSCVDSKVTFEGLQVPEACAADLTGVRLLPGVNEHVSTEMGHLQRAALGQDSPREEGIPLGARVSLWEWGSAQTSFLVHWVPAGSQGHVSEVCYLQSLRPNGAE